MNQTRRGSVVEAAVNITIGLLVSLTANHLVFPLYGFIPTLSQNASITAIYTTISFARSYGVRRLFNYFGGTNE